MQQGAMLLICGTVEDIVFYNEENGYVVLDMDCNNELVTAVGLLGDVHEGEELTLWGDYVNSPKYGRQFKAEVFERSLPKSKEAIRKYLGSGVIAGIGPAVAKRIVTAFGEDTLEIMESDSIKLASIKGITAERALSIGREFNKITGLRKAMTYFSKYGIQPITIASVWKQYEGRTMQVIKENPYIMCENGIELPFRDADRLAESLGIPKDSEERILAGIMWCLRVNAANGHTCVRENDLSETVCYELEISEKSFWNALSIAENRGDVTLDDKYDERFVFLSEYYKAECYIAQKLAEMIQRKDSGEMDYSEEIAGIEWTEGIQYEELQREAINGCMNNHIFILTGGPGTGKTTTLNAVISLCKQRGLKIKLAAPTGRAAKRMADLTGAQAQTIHRLLEVDFGAGGNSFKRCEENPLSCDVLVIDEMSMVDTLLMCSLLKAVKSKTRLIMVGDSNQLPSVGAGNILRDLIASGRVPMVELKEIFRQAAESLIVTNAHRIVRGEMPVLNDRKSDFFFMPTDSEEDTLRLVIELCRTRLPNTYGYTAFDDIQVLCPSKLGVVGTQSINQALQLALNPPAGNKQELKYFNQLFRTGDKVMQTKNDYDVEWRRGAEKSHGIFNGDIGLIRSADRANDRIEIDFDGRTAIYDTDMLKRVEHAYAVTIHKSQGSEYPAVIIPLPNGMDRLTYRNLLYTAVTRAKNILIVIGNSRKIQSMVENDRRALRYSCLKPILEDHFV
ncbi:MAG: ATP-dependent RecD-like DNA helicase [Oscillospiraceae bacterium]|nr:ATP-dependent RecD-like DNA helicase [Oscillospiraceae bacterium]